MQVTYDGYFEDLLNNFGCAMPTTVLVLDPWEL